MITGLGMDIVDLRRISRIMERFGRNFLRRILAPEELALIPAAPVPYIGGRFAAKEACAKALGTGFCDGIMPAQIAILQTRSGRPELVLRDNALAHAQALGAIRYHVSISHERDYAAAVVIMET